MTQTFQVVVDRYSPETKTASKQTYEVEFVPSQTVLQTLNIIRDNLDDSVSFRSSCQGAKCGSCAVALNGKPVLACNTMIDGQDITLGPLPNFPVIYDLIVDRSECEDYFFEMLAQTGSCEGSCKGHSHKEPEAVLPESKIDYDNLSRCLGCMVCTSACPYNAQMAENGPNPAMLVSVLSSGVLTEKEGHLAFPIGKNSDYCSLCLNCYTACPAGVHLNRANSQSKSAYVQTKGQKLRDRLLGHAEFADKAATLTPNLNNALVNSPLVRQTLEKTLGISSKPSMVNFSKPLTSERAVDKQPSVIANKHKVAFFTGCYARYNDTDTGKDAIAVLEKLGIQVEVPEQSCCGLPLIGNGDMATAEKKARDNVAAFKPWIEKGYDIVTTCTSCSLMLKTEYTEVFSIKAAKGMADCTYDLAEYINKLVDSNEIELNLSSIPMQTAYHTPCHLKSQKIGLPFIELLNKIPDFKIDVMEAKCCGQAGSYGYKAEKYPISEAVGNELKESMQELKPEIGLSECGPCQLRMHDVSGLPVTHPISILRRALK
ncbi:MAG: anaerobic glycerol-3-phosphate dehydrogenase subunit C [Desulfuromusa sp.]|nr:anaerobic glycerol-3-phosphate dehydrogenase subunit C [Desulfuromusa sp.]